MNAPLDFNGVHVFAVTPCDDDGAIAPERVAGHVRFMAESGIRSYTVFGSTGGIGSFNESERRTIAEAAITAAAGRLPVLVGTGSMQTAEAIRLSVHAREIGAAAIVVVPMTYWPLSESELLDHYRRIADVSGMPMVLYNNPRTTGVEMSPAFLAKLARIPTVVAVKESAPDVSRIAELVRETGGALKVLTGRDPQVLDAVAVGASGWFSGGANYMPAQCVDLLDRHFSGATDEARRRFDRLYPLTAFTIARGGIRCAHAALQLLDRSMGAPRAPLALPAPAEIATLAELMAQAGVRPVSARAALAA